jgi:hypothetical protein
MFYFLFADADGTSKFFILAFFYLPETGDVKNRFPIHPEAAKHPPHYYC